MHPLKRDLEYVLKKTAPFWEELRNQSIFLTGGTGFFGCWLLESFVWANTKLKLNATITTLTRSSSAFAKKMPHLYQDPSLIFLDGDVRDFSFPEQKFSHIIHAATEASTYLNENNPTLMLDTIIQGTKQTLEFARFCGAKKFLLTSSGAVYGRQPPEVTHLIEDYQGSLDLLDPCAAYSVGKFTAEHLSCLYAKQYGIDVKIARCFAFVGPYLPLDIHFAIGNFIQDGLNGGPIQVMGDGTPYRSYLYAADLAVWLWTILFKGASTYPYNVGSDEAYSIADIAKLVAVAFDSNLEVIVKKLPTEGLLPDRYVPSINRAKNELQLTTQIGIADAIRFTQQYYFKVVKKEFVID